MTERSGRANAGRGIGAGLVAGVAAGAIVGGLVGWIQHKRTDPSVATSTHGGGGGGTAGQRFKGFVGGLLQKHQPRVNLGYDWINIATDYDLTVTMDRLSKFRHVSEQHYRQVGDACDNVIGLWRLVYDPGVPTQAMWQAKTFLYKQQLDTALMNFSDAVEAARHARTQEIRDTLAGAEKDEARRAPRRTFAPSGNGRKESQFAARQQMASAAQESGVNLEEFQKCASVIHAIVKNYHASAISAIAAGIASGPIATGAKEFQQNRDPMLTQAGAISHRMASKADSNAHAHDGSGGDDDEGDDDGDDEISEHDGTESDRDESEGEDGWDSGSSDSES